MTKIFFNFRLAERQIVGLNKIKAFAQDTSLIEERQGELRTRCLQFWELPDKSRIAPHRGDAKLKFKELIEPESTGK